MKWQNNFNSFIFIFSYKIVIVKKNKEWLKLILSSQGNNYISIKTRLYKGVWVTYKYILKGLKQNIFFIFMFNDKWHHPLPPWLNPGHALYEYHYIGRETLKNILVLEFESEDLNYPLSPIWTWGLITFTWTDILDWNVCLLT